MTKDTETRPMKYTVDRTPTSCAVCGVVVPPGGLVYKHGDWKGHEPHIWRCLSCPAPAKDTETLRTRAENLYESIGGELCICQRRDVSHWCESCQRRIQLVMEGLQQAAADALSAPPQRTDHSRLYTLLRPFLRHAPTCACDSFDTGLCDCGLRDALKKAEAVDL